MKRFPFFFAWILILTTGLSLLWSEALLVGVGIISLIFTLKDKGFLALCLVLITTSSILIRFYFFSPVERILDLQREFIVEGIVVEAEAFQSKLRLQRPDDLKGEIFLISGNQRLGDCLKFRAEPKAKSFRESLKPASLEWRAKEFHSLFRLKPKGQVSKCDSLIPVPEKSQSMNRMQRLREVLLKGNQKLLTQEEWQAFNHFGLSHLFVISGLHIGFVFLILHFLMRKILFSFCRKPLRLIHLVVTFSALGIFALSIETGLPSIRALGMLFFYLIVSEVFPSIQRYQKSEIVSFFGILFAIFDPFSLVSKSYWFSFGMTWGIGCLADQKKLSSWNIAMLSTILISCLGHFFQIEMSPLSPLMNLTWGVLFLLIGLPLVLLSYFSIQLETFLLPGFDYLFDQMILFSRFLEARIGFIELSTVSSFLILASTLYLLMQRAMNLKTGLFLTLGNFVLLSPTLNEPQISTNLKIRFIDVGQGDAILLEVEGQRLLIDGGFGRGLEESRRFFRHSKLDFWILSHFDRDHSGSFLEFSARFRPTEIWAPALGNSRESQLLKKGAIQAEQKFGIQSHCGQRFCFGVWTDASPSALKVKNRESSVFYLWEKQSLRLIFVSMGDLPKSKERKFLKFLKSQKVVMEEGTEVLKVGHHGSKTSTAEYLLEALKPKRAVILSGRENSYGFPHVEVTERLNRFGIQMLRVDCLGTFQLIFNFQ